MTTRLTDGVEPRHFADWEQAANSAGGEFGRPICLITGHPRSGTTLLEQMLDNHRKISSADESSSLLHSLFTPLVGESESVPTASQLLLESVSQQQVNTGRDEYRRRLEYLVQGDAPQAEKRNTWLIDKNPESIVMLPVLQRSVPTARVIVVLRDPRDVCLSCFMQFLPATPASVNFDSLENTARKYARTMKLWLKIRPLLRLDWCEIKYEDLVNDPVVHSRRALEFLDLDFDDRVLRFAEHVRTKTVHSPSYHSVAKPIYKSSIGRWRNSETSFGAALKTLEPFIETFGYQ